MFEQATHLVSRAGRATRKSLLDARPHSQNLLVRRHAAARGPF